LLVAGEIGEAIDRLDAAIGAAAPWPRCWMGVW